MNVMDRITPIITEEKARKRIEEGVVYETTDYDMFKRLTGNRKKHEPQVIQLKHDIQDSNMLMQNPILVNENMEVINGQHRLQAAREMGLPIYFTVKFGATLKEAKMLQHSRNWLTQDYLNSYVEKGKDAYITVKDFAEKYRISIAIAIHVLSGKFSGEALEAFKAGTFKVEDFDRADNLADLISEVRRHSPDRAWVHRDCIRALAIVQEKTDPKLLTQQLEQYQMVITRRASTKDYLREFSNIINANRKGKQVDLF